MLEELGLLTPRVSRTLRDAWREVVGENVASRTRLGSFRRGRLVVEVGSAALLHELQNFQKTDILGRLQLAHPTPWIAEIRFRQGAVSPA